MRYSYVRRLLILYPAERRHRLRTLNLASLPHDPREDYFLLGGEALCQYLLREDPEALVIARGPLPFLAGNKTTVGYISPLTQVPHYSFVGGRAFAELLNLGLDAVVFAGSPDDGPAAYPVISGRAPRLEVVWASAADLPAGQRSAFHWLLDRELDGRPEAGSVLTLGEAARRGYRAANVAVDGIYHAGRGGAGHVLARFAAALVLRGTPMTLDAWFGPRADAFRDLRNAEVRRRIETYCARLSRRDGGTVTKLYATGHGASPTLPAHNAQRLGYDLADLGARRVLKASRVGQTGCHWCQVNCRHWHWVDVDYVPEGRDTYLDDFEPTYALFAMLDLASEVGEDGAGTRARVRLLDAVDRRLVVPIEQLGCDVIDMGVGLAALFEGLGQGVIPPEDVPPFLRQGPYFGALEPVARAVDALRQGTQAPALRALGDGPQALAQRYPAMQDRVFTCGPRTLGNPGHANALWTFLMPLSRFFGHYVGQIYKVPGELPSSEDAGPTFRRVIQEMLRREQFGCLCNALSFCAFVFVVFSQDGQGVELDDEDLLVRVLRTYGLDVRREDLVWFAEAFWAQSIALKMEHGWRPPRAADFPARVFVALSQALGRPAPELRELMAGLIVQWQRQAGAILDRHGYAVPPDWVSSAT